MRIVTTVEEAEALEVECKAELEVALRNLVISFKVNLEKMPEARKKYEESLGMLLTATRATEIFRVHNDYAMAAEPEIDTSELN